MNDDLTQTLLLKYMTQEAKLSALTQILTSLIARSAGEYERSQEYIMTLISPIYEMAKAFDPEDHEMAEIGESLLDFAEKIETDALGLLQP